jgi:aminoglycoside phosphotransferase (APT) family kinase protein
MDTLQRFRLSLDRTVCFPGLGYHKEPRVRLRAAAPAVKHPRDAGLQRTLERFGLSPDALLGHGGEARVYALDAKRVLRVHHAGTPAETVEARRALLTELAAGAERVPFAIPEVLDSASVGDRIATIETRLPGEPAMQVLDQLRGEARASLLRSHLDAAARIGDLPLERPWFGDLLQTSPIRTQTQRAYLQERGARSLAGAGPGFQEIDAAALAEALPEPEQRGLVHLDAFTGNMLACGETISAVLDFGTVAIVADPRLDPLAAAAYLASEITPCATPADRSLAEEWLAEQGLAPLYGPARRWLAAYWSIARDDLALHSWCRSVLLR